MMSLTVYKFPENELESDKISKLKKQYETKFNTCPEFYVRAPGRINMVGEHVDYCGYAVLPMAIEQDITIAVGTNTEEKLYISNVSDQYEDFECDLNFSITDVKHGWYKYILCGLQGIKDEAEVERTPKGFSLLVVGSVPPAAGLSSSSALVCASALLFAYVLQMNITHHALAELCARAERYIGTQGGGMDQAASLLSKPGAAQIIEFNPLKCTPVSIPEGAKLVVANSLVQNNKAAGSMYNTRVVECRLACRLLAKKSSIPLDRNIQLGELQRGLRKSFSEMVELVKKYIHPQPYSKQELCQLLNMSVSRLEKEVLSPNTLHLTEFELQKRALHIFTEASRVWEFKNICDDWRARAKISNEEDRMKVLHQLGKLMEESHSSLQYLYECSHPQLDKMAEISKGIAFGARLTGAGWGGCLIALVSKNRVEEYKNMMKCKYYNAEDLEVDDWSNVLFSTAPCGGACILIPSDSY